MIELVVKYKAEKVFHEEMGKMPLVDLKVLEVYTKSKEEHESHLKINLELLKKEKFHVKPNKALYGRRGRSPVLKAEIGESKMIGLEFEQETTKKCLANASLHVSLDEIKVDKTLRFVKEPVKIVDREVKRLKHSKISLMKVRWKSKCGLEFTWEHEDYMKSKYPQLFVERADESAIFSILTPCVVMMPIDHALRFRLGRDIQDSPDDKKDTRSSQEYFNDLEEDYQERALLAKSKIFFKKGSQRPTKDFEAKYNNVKAKMALLNSSPSFFKSSMVKNKGLVVEAYEWDEEDVSSDDNEMVEVKVLMALADEENIVVDKESAKNAEGFILPNHETGRILPTESQMKVTDPSVTVTDSLATEYDSADETSVCSTSLPPLVKLISVEPVSGPKTIKSILKSNSIFKAETLKGVIINEPILALSKGNKYVSASKKNSTLAGKLKNVKTKDDIPLSVVMKEPNDLKLKINKNQSSYSRNNNSQQCSVSHVDADVDSVKRCGTSNTFDVRYMVLKDLILHRSSINNSASLSNKFGGFYFSFKFAISGFLHQVVTSIADRIREELKRHLQHWKSFGRLYFVVFVLVRNIQKKDVIQYPHFTKLINDDLMKKLDSIPPRLKENYHSIIDDILLVSVYSSGNVIVRGMLISDAFIIDEIRANKEYKEYEQVFVGVDIPTIQPQLVISTNGMHRTTLSAHRSPTLTTDIALKKKKKERDEIAEATLPSITLHKTAIATEAQENVAKVQEKLVEEEIENMVKGEEVKESYACEFADSMLNDDDDDSGTRIELESHKKHSENINDDDDET
nr:putative reverse transcriptase domain-containing protein [Tanacetum cinerariifolium]